MKAAVVHTFGQAPLYEDFADPTPEAGETLVQVLAAGVHPIVRSLARGTHYGSTDRLPLIPGVDGIGRLENGSRVYFGMVRDPYGTLAELAAAPKRLCVPLPESLDDASAAALFNPGMSAWLSLNWRAQLVPGETVLVLGATGAAGQLAVQIAKLTGAGKVIAAGRKRDILEKLASLGADATIDLTLPDAEVVAALTREAGENGIHVIIDYLWGHPTELTIEAITRRGLTHVAPRVRLVEVGQMAGRFIKLDGAVLRSSGLEITGSGAGSVPIERIVEAMPRFLGYAAEGKLHVETTVAPLAEVNEVWDQPTLDNRRLVLVP